MPDLDTVFSASFNYLCVLDKNKTVYSEEPIIQMFTLILTGFHFNEPKLMPFYFGGCEVNKLVQINDRKK